MASYLPCDGNMIEVLQALNFEDLIYCDEIHLLKPWFDCIYPENILTAEEEEALSDCEALGFKPEDLNEKIIKHGIDLNYLDTTDEYITLLESELNALQLIDTTVDVEKEVCRKMKRILKEVQEKDISASDSLQQHVNLCLEQWEGIQQDCQRICDIVHEITQHYFSGNNGDEFQNFLRKYEEKVKILYTAAMDIVSDKCEARDDQHPEMEIKGGPMDTSTPLSTAEQNKMKASHSQIPCKAPQNMKEAISRLKKSLTLLYYTGLGECKGKDSSINGMTVLQSNFCVKDYAFCEEPFRYKTLLACEELAEEVVALKVLIPESRKRYEMKKEHLEFSQKLLDALKEHRDLQQLVSLLLSLWNIQKKELYNVLKDTTLLYEQDYACNVKRTTALADAKQKFLNYVHSSSFEEGCFPAGLWKAVRKLGIPDDLNCGLRSATAAEEQKINSALHMLKQDLDKRERNIETMENLYSEGTASNLEQEKHFKQMQMALEESEKILNAEKEKHQAFKDLTGRDKGSKIIRLCWAYFLVDPQKLINLAETLKEEKEKNEFLSSDYTIPLLSSTPKSVSDESLI